MNSLLITRIFKPYKELREWIDESKLVWSTLSMNPNAVHMFEKNKDKLNMCRVVRMKEAMGFIESNLDLLYSREWACLCENPAAIALLERYPERVNISKLCSNPNGKEILDRYIQERDIYDPNIDIMQLCTNPGAVDMLNRIYSDENDDSEENIIISQVYFELLLKNPNVMSINIVKNNFEFLMYMNIDVSGLFENSNKDLKDLMLQYIDIAVKQKRSRSMSLCMFAEEIYIDRLHIFDEEGNLIDPDREHLVDWTSLCKNRNAIRLLKNNLDKVDWKWLSINPAAIGIIKENMDRVNWTFLSGNPEIFRDCYDIYYRYVDIIDMILS